MDKNIKKMPTVTVLLPVYNGEKYLKEAIDSILNQTFKDFEFLIINDGSTDRSEEIIKSYNDTRIRLIKNEKNLGLIKTLNKGIQLASGDYIARMDADDISLPNRLKEQIKFMRKNQEIGISGTWTKVFGDFNFTEERLTKSEEIKANFIFLTSLSHPSVIMRTKLIKKYKLNYDSNFPHSEDRELWARASNYFPITNLNKILLLYRLHQKSVSRQNKEIQKNSGNKVIKKLLSNLNLNVNEKELLIHRSFTPPPGYDIPSFLEKIERWLILLKKQNKKTSCYQEKAFLKIIRLRWLSIIHVNLKKDLSVWKKFRESPLSTGSFINHPEKSAKILIIYLFKLFTK